MLALDAVWVSFGPVLIINAFFLTSIAYYALTGAGEVHEAHDAARRHTSKWLNRFFKEWWVWWTDPIARLMVKLRMTPNIVTFIGFLFAPITALLFATELYGYAGWAMVFGASFDLFDGRVARLTGKMSRSGAYFDSVMDRFSEGICFIGLAFAFRSSWILFFVIAGLIGSMLVSYTKARGDSVGIDCKGGSMQRPERIVYLGVAAILQPVATLIISPLWNTAVPFLVIAAVVLIGVMTNATAVYRMIYIMNAIDSVDRQGQEQSIPQIMSKLTTSEGREELWEQARHEFLARSSRKRNQR